MITVVTGIRELAPASFVDVEMTVLDELYYADELRFGGALGVDDVALATALEYRVGHMPRLRVFVPFTWRDQPAACQPTIRRADEVVELRLPKSKAAYLRRNDAMLQGANRVLAFTDGRQTGGTWYTVQRAAQAGLPVVVTQVGRARHNPWIPDFDAPVFAYRPYVSARRGARDWTSDVVRRLKVDGATGEEIEQLADELLLVIRRESALESVDAVVPMPRRTPNVESDLHPLAEALAQRLDANLLDRWLERIDEPVGGVVKAYRLRFPEEEHARTLRVTHPTDGRVLLLDNVLTTGGTMAGAIAAIRRDSPQTEVVGLAVLYSESF